MPRRKSNVQDDFIEQAPPLMLTSARPAHHGHEHKHDAYEPLLGAIPGKVSNVVEGPTSPIKRRMTQADIVAREEAKAERRAAAKRWNKYLDYLHEFEGNTTLALANVYGITTEEVLDRLDELALDVRRGIGATDIGRVMERNALDVESRARILNKHAYGPIPAASLAAIKIASEMADDTDTAGAWETFLRSANSSA